MPDDYQWLVGAERQLLEDQAELAARVHILSVYDRRGQVIWGDRGAAGLSSWEATSSGAGASILTVPSGAYLPGFAFASASTSS